MSSGYANRVRSDSDLPTALELPSIRSLRSALQRRPPSGRVSMYCQILAGSLRSFMVCVTRPQPDRGPQANSATELYAKGNHSRDSTTDVCNVIDCFLRFMVIGIASVAHLIMRSWSGWSASGNLAAHMR